MARLVRATVLMRVPRTIRAMTPLPLHELPVQEPERRKRAPGARQLGSFDRPDVVAGGRLAGCTKEMFVGPYLLLAPGFIRHRRDVIGEDLGHARGAPHGRDHRPKRVVARGVQADWFNHTGKLTWIFAEIKREQRTNPAVRRKKGGVAGGLATPPKGGHAMCA